MRYADVPASAVNAVTAALSVRFREVLTLARCDRGRSRTSKSARIQLPASASNEHPLMRAVALSDDDFARAALAARASLP